MEMPRTHEITYRVRFDEADATGHLRPSGLLRYTQDLAWQHSEAAGFDRDWYDERGAFWLVRMVALRTYARARYGDRLRATTEVTGWRRVWARRHTTFLGVDAQVMGEAETDWVLLTTAGRPKRIPDEISRYFAPGSTYRPGRLALSPTPAEARISEAQVRAADVDPFGHLNNAGYLDLVDAAAADAGLSVATPRSLKLEYVRPALEGDALRLATWRTDAGQVACRITGADGLTRCRAIIEARSDP